MVESPIFIARVAMNLFLYALTVLIWGTTWIAIKWQLGVVPPPVSIAWRFGLAALILLDRKSTRLNSSHCVTSRMPSSA